MTPVTVLWVRAEDTRELARLIAEKIGNLKRRRLVSISREIGRVEQVSSSGDMLEYDT